MFFFTWIGYSTFFFLTELADTPSNLMTPSIFCERATQLFSNSKVEVKTRDLDYIKTEKMGLLQAVSQGSAQEPKLLELLYYGGSEKNVNVVLVGKGVTFDTGGINLKPDVHMNDMKGDMVHPFCFGCFRTMLSFQCLSGFLIGRSCMRCWGNESNF